MLADINHIAILQPMGADKLFIDKRAIFALQVDINKSITCRIDFAMVTGYGQVFDDDIIVFPAPNF
jgi:hypothetical protein